MYNRLNKKDKFRFVEEKGKFFLSSDLNMVLAPCNQSVQRENVF